MLVLTVFVVLFLLSLYLWHVERTISNPPAEAIKLASNDWTKQDIEDAYQKAQQSPTDVKPFLFSKRNRRYIVTGGSGLVGGWIVSHLLMRGEDPAAIRILDLTPSERQDAIEAGVDFVKADVSKLEAVKGAFSKPWPNHVKSLPVTVFHCVAFITAKDRKSDFLSPYVSVNIIGTKNVLEAAQEAGTSCFIATSSGSIAMKPVKFFPWPWQRRSKTMCQFLGNADPEAYDAPLEAFGTCYTWSKAQAEKLVLDANNIQAGFSTGSIRPAHAIYGHKADNIRNLTYDYLQRGNSPAWYRNVTVQFANAQNVSIGHLAYENVLLNKTHPGGKGYVVTDSNSPIRYTDVFNTLQHLAHPLTPLHFPYTPSLPIFFIAYAVETYLILRARYFPFLPIVTGDLMRLQPGSLMLTSTHLVFTDTDAQRDIGYKAPIGSKEGLALAVLDWNERIEKKANAKI